MNDEMNPNTNGQNEQNTHHTKENGPGDGQPEEARPAFEDLPPAAQRALKEAEERRKHSYGELELSQKEVNGRNGPEAVRYGDWEKDGIISDF